MFDLLLFAFVLNFALCVVVANVAKERGKSPGAYFALAFFFSALIALLILLASSASVARKDTTEIASDEQSEKWRALVDLDPDIAAAAQRVRALGPGFERLLAKKYLAIGDKSYLEAAVEFVVQAAASGPMIGSNEPNLLKQVEVYKGHQVKMAPDRSEFYAAGRTLSTIE
jgi:hypothetical protein